MNRKGFLKNSILGLAGMSAGSKVLKASNVKLKHSTYDKMIDQVGFNHLPNKEIKNMKSVIHKANTRGHANHGWLDTHHTFSFANYYNPERMNFGVLRVLNDDRVAPGRGFSTHPHDNMEIISIPLMGSLEHKDSMGNVAIIEQGDVQLMSAGTGIFHSEYNHKKDEEVRFLQIWMFPNKKDVTPRYDQISLKDVQRTNELYQILSPNKDDAGVWVHQDAWFHLGQFDSNKSETYNLKKSGNGVYLFVLEGSIEFEGQTLDKRDGLGVWETEELSFKANPNSRILLMEVPMSLG